MANVVRMYVEGAVEEFNFVYLIIGLVPWIYFSKIKTNKEQPNAMKDDDTDNDKRT